MNSSLFELANDSLVRPLPTLAEVLEFDEDNRIVEVRCEGEPATYRALLAVELVSQLQPGDQVLLIEGANDSRFVIGVVHRKAPRRHTFTMDNGQSVTVDMADSHVQIHDRQDHTIFDFDGADNAMQICAPSTSVELIAAGDNLALKSAAKVIIESEQGVEITSPRFSVNSVDTDLRGDRLESVFHQQRFVGHRIDYVCETMMSTVRNAYQFVADLVQMKARRSRSIVEETSETHAKEIRMKAQEDVKVDGNHIHLG